MNIAMWSGPRNLSTAMMYSFAAREDCRVVDEPFYGAYLNETGLDHPMKDEIIASMELNPAVISRELAADTGGIFYQKHMTQHMINAIPRDWMSGVRHAFLIRHPARVIASYAAKKADLTLADIGFVQQLELFHHAQTLGQHPVIVDSFDIRRAPEDTLRKLCDALGIPWDDRMLSWPSGGNAADGIWAAHWYGAVHLSTGFAAPEGSLPQIDPHFDEVYGQAEAIYEELSARAI